jgi:hypothetical protein
MEKIPEIKFFAIEFQKIVVSRVKDPCHQNHYPIQRFEQGGF